MNNLATIEEVNVNECIASENYSPTEADAIVNKIIDQHINYYKLDQLKQWVANENNGNENCQQRIQDLNRKRQELIQTIKDARQQGVNVHIENTLVVKIENKHIF